jgi:hypothetical protein
MLCYVMLCYVILIVTLCILYYYVMCSLGRVAQSVYRLATGWTAVRGANPCGDEIFRTFRPWGPPSLLYNEYRVFPGGRKRLGRDVDPSPPSSVEV